MSKLKPIPEGYRWHVATHQEDVGLEELTQRAAALSKG